MATFVVGETVETARIPELTQAADALTLNDRIPVWIASIDKTRKATLNELLTLIGTGGSGGTTVPPVVDGGEYLYIVPDDIPDGTTTIALSQFAGMTFNLTRGGLPMIKQSDPPRDDAEFEILDTGGFRLLQDGDSLRPGERFNLRISQLIGAGGSGTPGATPATLFTGDFPITTNITLNDSHFGKLLQIRTNGAPSPITVTLPSVADVPANTILVFETDINNDWQNKIATSGGQNIYMRGSSFTGIYMGLGETLWLKRSDDGWYVINNFGKIYEGLGEPKASYKVGINQLNCKGQTVTRSSYPRLWEWIQTLGSSLVSDATWSTASVTVNGRTVPNPNRGCFSTGDGSTTFRLPDLQNVFLRGLLSDTGTDSERSLNKPGGFQDNVNKKFWPGTPTKPVILQVNGADTTGPTDTDGGLTQPNLATPLVVDKNTFSTESRPDNVGIFWVINC